MHTYTQTAYAAYCQPFESIWQNEQDIYNYRCKAHKHTHTRRHSDIHPCPPTAPDVCRVNGEHRYKETGHETTDGNVGGFEAQSKKD